MNPLLELADRVEGAIAVSDAAAKACPVNAGRIGAKDRCPLCGAMASETCFRTAAADYRAIQIITEIAPHLRAIASMGSSG